MHAILDGKLFYFCSHAKDRIVPRALFTNTTVTSERMRIIHSRDCLRIRFVHESL